MYFSLLKQTQFLRYYSTIPSTIKYITINNPAKRNALSKNVLLNLKQDFLQVKQNSSIKVVILKSEGPVFSSGHDLKELTSPENNNKEFHKEIFGLCSEVMELIHSLPQPVIAQVQGLATAAGCQLVSTCDLAICSPQSQFATPGVTIGLFCSTPAVALVRSMTSSKKVAEMLFTGKPISAQEAQQYGLVNRIASSHEKLEEETLEMATHISQFSGEVLQFGKQVLREQSQINQLHDAYTVATDGMVCNLGLADCKEGIEAFIQKRKPNWK